MSNTTLEIVKNQNKKAKPDPETIGFGKHFTDHMFLMNYEEGKGWYDPRIVPYGPISLDPSAKIFHYGQTVFEGLKAYRTEDNRILLFRPEENFKRLNLSNDRLSIPPVDEEFMLECLNELVKLEQDWVPDTEGQSLYIRPFIIATEESLVTAPSKSYLLMIILSPVGAYYPEGINPVTIYVEDEYKRAVRGGTGTAKTGGNYSASYTAQENAHQKGYTQVLWLDAIENKYIEEVGSMNVFFKINGEVVTPALSGSILSGITRKSIIELLKSWDVPVVEQQISIEELYQAYENGSLEEAFGTGTAAVISPIGELIWKEHNMVINNKQTGALSKRVYETLTGIQTGRIEDRFNWIKEVK
ncbi:branched-chain amino acid aminotransferase [Anaerobacillus sp. MEB173]|uniref:branched-chain amino acid aminotransferase n=1 Tax=Anaerobacillus sp. MEB173 TaxID=3383345 RepID=UPI003F937C3A